MAIFPKRVPFREAWRDLRAAIVAPRKHKIVFATASIGAPLGLFAAMFQQAKVDEEWVPPKIVYIQQWDANRTVDDVRRQQAIDLPAEKAEKDRIAAAREDRRKQFERVAKKMDDLGL